MTSPPAALNVAIDLLIAIACSLVEFGSSAAKPAQARLPFSSACMKPSVTSEVP
jgi:hypothetical protein